VEGVGDTVGDVVGASPVGEGDKGYEAAVSFGENGDGTAVLLSD
jgi:hypothetical protein